MLSHYPDIPTISASLAEHRRSLLALADASQAALDHAAAIVAANRAAIEAAVADLELLLHRLHPADADDVRAARQVAVFAGGLERAGDNMQRLCGAIRQAQAAARSVISQRVLDAMDEAAAMDGHVRPA